MSDVTQQDLENLNKAVSASLDKFRALINSELHRIESLAMKRIEEWGTTQGMQIDSLRKRLDQENLSSTGARVFAGYVGQNPTDSLHHVRFWHDEAEDWRNESDTFQQEIPWLVFRLGKAEVGLARTEVEELRDRLNDWLSWSLKV